LIRKYNLILLKRDIFFEFNLLYLIEIQFKLIYGETKSLDLMQEVRREAQHLFIYFFHFFERIDK